MWQNNESELEYQGLSLEYDLVTRMCWRIKVDPCNVILQ